MAIHYAPRTPTYRMERDQIPEIMEEGRFCKLIFGDLPDRIAFPLTPPVGVRIRTYQLATPRDASEGIYARLHELDDLGLDYILIIPPPDEPLWQAVRDRIWRASRPWPGA